MEEKNGDAEFEKFIEDNSCPSIHGLMAVIRAIKEKMNFVSKNYQETLQIYKDLKAEDPLKMDLRNHIKSLMELSLKTADQIDYALMSFEDDDGSTEKDEEDDDEDKGIV